MFDNSIDIPRIYTALAEWCACFVFCFILPRKINNYKFAGVAVLSLLAQSLLLITTKHAWIYLWFPIMVLAVLLMYLFVAVSVNLSVKGRLYFTLKAFLVAEFAASLEWQIAYFLESMVKMNTVLHVLVLYLVYSAVFTGLYFLEKKMRVQEFDYEISQKELISVILIVLVVFSFSNLSFLTINTPFSGGQTMDRFNVRTLVDMGGLAILYAYQSRVFELQVEKELLAINTVLQSQYDNYRNYSESIDLINLKYHDLKHQIEGLRGEMSTEKRTEWINSIEEELQAYRPEQQTGNYTLDTLLSGKLNSCSKQNIKFTCVVDGKLLSFIHVIDLCNIFGNALDNAIENVALVEDEQKRLIHMKVFAQGALLFISVTNYCDHKLKIRNGYPISTKVDKANHGFGMKSMDYAVKKYNGSLSYGVEQDMFELKILIPMKKIEG